MSTTIQKYQFFCCSFELSIQQRILKKKDYIMVSTKILSSTTLIIIRNVS